MNKSLDLALPVLVGYIPKQNKTNLNREVISTPACTLHEIYNRSNQNEAPTLIS
jgi:hypothetical protein